MTGKANRLEPLVFYYGIGDILLVTPDDVEINAKIEYLRKFRPEFSEFKALEYVLNGSI